MNSRTLMKVVASVAALTTVGAACGSSKASAPKASAAATTAAAAGAATTAAAAPASTAAAAAGAVTLKYQLWDDQQLPLYQKCADAFTAKNPTIKIDMKQLGWSDYWDGLTAGFATGNVPDVFTDHLAKYPDFIKSGVLTPIDDLVKKDNVDLTQYSPGLADLWVGYDGKRYGLPKDWDTIALLVDQNQVDKAGLKADTFNSADWNPKDGGSWEKLIAHLTVDKNGKRGDEAGFDKANVATYGFGMDVDAYGQTGFSSFAASNGFNYLDKDPWGTHYNYDTPALTDTILYFKGLVEKGFMAPVELWNATGGDTMMSTNKVASRPIGDWTINQWLKEKGIKANFVKTPKGPKGYASMFNGLADSITKSSKHQAESWQWVKFLSSPDCENIIGAAGVVFPAIPAAAKASQDAHKAAGVDVSAFTFHVDNKTTFLTPIAQHPAEISKLMGDAITAVLSGKGDANTLIDANKQANDLLKS